MAGNQITFVPEDFDSVLTLEDLISHITTIITEIRNNDNIGKETRNSIEELQNIAQNGLLTKDSSIQELFLTYENIKKVSMHLRNMLSRFIQLDTYDSIEYAFYYNGKRYSVEEISSNWLIKGSNGELRLNLDNAVNDLKEKYSEKSAAKLQDIFAQHYASYFAAISGTYNGIIGHSRLNKGHIAEAYEAHLSEHHTAAYQLLNIPIISTIDKILSASDLAKNPGAYWSTHENINEAWIHVRGALGTQRGTVAGDVGRFQVKSGSNNSEYSSQVRLASLTTLNTGIKNYCDIINPDIPISEIARKIAMYLSEPVKTTDQNLQSFIANKEIAPIINNMTKLRHI